MNAAVLATKVEQIWLDENLAAELLGYSPGHLRKIKHNYVTRQTPSRKQPGKLTTLYLLSSLSPAAQRRYHAAHAVAVATEAAPVAPAASAEKQQDWLNSLPAAPLAVVMARFRPVQDYNRAVADLPPNSHGLKTEVLAAICIEHDISRGTLYRRVAAFSVHGLKGLADARFGQRRSTLTPEMENYIIGCIGRRPHSRAARIHEYVERHFKTEISYTTIRRFMSLWKNKNHALAAAITNPDSYKSNYQVAFGDMSAKAKHFLHFIEMDSSPADIICADAKRYTLIGVIDIFSRKAKVLVWPVSNAAGIARLFGQVLSSWGVPENVIKDNGRDYMSRHIKQIEAAFAIHAPFVPKFTPEAKPHIERFYGTIARGLLEELAGYIGHSVAERKAIEGRKSFAERFMGGEAITVGLSADMLQTAVDNWLDGVYHQRVHRTLGCAPEVMAARSPKHPARVADLAALEIVLLPESIRTVGKKGIRLENGTYAAAGLAGFVREKVRVKLDAADISRIYVYTLAGEFVCQARDIDAAPLTVEEITRAKAAQRRTMKEKIKAVNALSAALDDPARALLEMKHEDKKVTALIRAGAASNDALQQASLAASGAHGTGGVRSVAANMGWDESGEGPLDWMDGIQLVEVKNE